MPQAIEGSDIEAVLREHERSLASQGQFRAKQAGSFNLRILPPVPSSDAAPGRRLYFEPFAVHFGLRELGARSSHQRIACLARMRDQACPMCDLHDELRFRMKKPDGSIDKRVEDVAKKIRAADRVAMNVLNLDQPAVGVQIWELGRNALDEKVQPIFKIYKDITNSAEGRDLRVDFGQKGEYLVVSSILPLEKSAIDEARFPKWRTDRKNLRAYAETDLIDEEQMLGVMRNSRIVQALGLFGAKPGQMSEPETNHGHTETHAHVEPEGNLFDEAPESSQAGPVGTAEPAPRSLEQLQTDPKVQAILKELLEAQKKARGEA